MSSMGLWLQKWAYHRLLTPANLTWVFHKAIILPLRQQVPHLHSHITGNRAAAFSSPPLPLTASCSETAGNDWMTRETGKIQSFHPARVVKIEMLLQKILKWHKKVSPVKLRTYSTHRFACLSKPEK